MRARNALSLAIVAVVAVAVCMLVRSALVRRSISYPALIWQQKDGAGLDSILPSRGCIGVLGYANKKYFMYCLDVTGRVLSTKEIGPEGYYFMGAGASRDRPLFCFIYRKKPWVIDMEKGKIHRPELKVGEHAIPMPYVLPPNTPALCPCGKSMLLSGYDKQNGKARHRSWVVDSLSGKLIREVVDRPKGRDSFYHYVWNDDCTLTWLDLETGLIRNERKGILSRACSHLVPSLPAGTCIKLSPDASTLAIYDPKVSGKLDVTFYDTATGKKRYEARAAVRRSERIWGVYWSPDSSKVCVGLCDNEDSGGFTNELYVIRQGGDMKKISPPGWQFFGLYGHVAWLYDSKHLVCLLYSSDGERRAMGLFDVDRP